MKSFPFTLTVILFCLSFPITPGAGAEQLVFKDDFHGQLGEGWSWIREHRQAWRIGTNALEVRIEPGNMWGPQNDAKNVLVRPAPAETNAQIQVSLTVENKPTHQYEQVDLVWFYDESNMVKLGQELVDGKLSVVMGREQSDKTRTIAIVPLTSSSVELRISLKGESIRGEFRPVGESTWREVGACDLPAHGKPRISLQFYQGAPNDQHWARVSRFRIQASP